MSQSLAKDVLGFELGQWLAACLPEPILKDIVSLRLAYKIGGWFIDLDFASTGVRLSSIDEEWLFSDEPTTKPGTAFHRRSMRCSFAIFRAPAGADWMINLADSLQQHWIQFAAKIVRRESEHVNWKAPWGSVSRSLMKNQDSFTKQVVAAGLDGHIQPTLRCNPMPFVMKSMGELGLSNGIRRIPSMSELLATSVTLNLWGSQWNAQLQSDILDLANVACRVRLDFARDIPRPMAMSALELQVWFHVNSCWGELEELMRKRQRVG